MEENGETSSSPLLCLSIFFVSFLGSSAGGKCEDHQVRWSSPVAKPNQRKPNQTRSCCFVCRGFPSPASSHPLPFLRLGFPFLSGRRLPSFLLLLLTSQARTRTPTLPPCFRFLLYSTAVAHQPRPHPSPTGPVGRKGKGNR